MQEGGRTDVLQGGVRITGITLFHGLSRHRAAIRLVGCGWWRELRFCVWSCAAELSQIEPLITAGVLWELQCQLCELFFVLQPKR